ncbi:MAG TPA: PQQ-binding-like beta-propeller repeat protein [Pyrinomonadaceae bacterium]|jgi:outer membrane protein assembly factor BamB|nr:PQQ-binding-like beta-propeller repeat protein [Pyrinomonadaceae bacterium]
MLYFRSSQVRTRSFVVGRALFTSLLLIFFIGSAYAATATTNAAASSWSTKLDGRVRFYQATELGVIVAGTERSLYGVDGETGDVLWRRKNLRLDETDVAPVPGTDLVLLSLEQGDKTRVEATDLLTGDVVWQSDKARGACMQMAVDQSANLLAVVLVRDPKGRAREGFKRRPVVHMFDLSDGRELWHRELESEVEMMPVEWREDQDHDTPYTLDNYRAPAFLDSRLYLFYEGVTSLDARTGKERRREKFRVNEEGLALTEADAVLDERYIYTSGRGRVRAVSRTSGEEIWEAKDLGLTPELVLAREILYVRTGGQFTRLKDGETIERGPYGVSALDTSTGKTLWRYKGADKGITNIALPDQSTIIIADRDDLITIDAQTGKRRARTSHHVERAAFVLINERGEAVVGGRDEIAGFDIASGRERWRARHEPPGRGVLRTLAAIAARAASLYFRYGGAATTAFRGVQVARTLSTLRWSGLASRVVVPNLTTMATDRARDYVTQRFVPFGLASRVGAAARLGQRPSMPSVPTIRAPRIPTPSRDQIEERLLDRLDPAHQLERLSRFLWRRRRLATLRGEWMYYYTDLRNGRGLAGVNLNTGATEREVRLSDPDDRFIADETTSLLYTSKDDRLLAYSLGGRVEER